MTTRPSSPVLRSAHAHPYTHPRTRAGVAFFIMLLAGIALSALGCGRPSSAEEAKSPTPAEAPPLDVKTVAARQVKVPRLLTLSGSLIGAEQAQVAAGAAGKVLGTYVERGSVVRKGALLARLDTRMIAAQAEEAEAQVESLKVQQALATLDCQRTQQMFEKGALAKADFDRTQSQCLTAKWSLAGAEARRTQMTEALRDSEIRAPFSGMVVERAVSAGEYVRVDTRVATLVSVDALRVELTVPEGDVTLVKEGMPITFRLASGSRDTVFQGRVRYIGPAVRQQTRDAVVEAVVENPSHELRPGMFVTSELALGEQTLPAVPRSAVREDGAQRHIFVSSGGRLEERLVQVIEGSGAEVPIVNGVKAGERVVAELTPDVRDGARLKP